MKTLLIFAFIYGAMIANSFWEAYVEARNPWDKRKLGWKINFGKYCLPAYHFYLFFVMYPLLLALPLVVNGWNFKLFGILVSAYASGLAIEDFFWYVINPDVKFKEWWTPFSDYYPWFTIQGNKIVPIGYLWSTLVALLSWWFIWR